MAQDPFGLPSLGELPKLPSFGTEERALKTEESKLMKILDFLYRPDSAKNDLLVGILKGHSEKKILKNITASLKGERVTTDTAIVDIVAGKQKKGASFAEKAARFTAGLASGVVTSPWNLLGIGALTKAGKLARAGRVSEEAFQTSKNVSKSLQDGQRALFSVAGVETPGFVNRWVGSKMEGVGKVIDALPGIGKLKETWGITFQKLNAPMKKMFGEADAEIRKILPQWDEVQKGYKSAVKLFDETKIPAKSLSMYKALGYSKERMVQEEIARIIEQPISKWQQGHAWDVVGPLNEGLPGKATKELLKIVRTLPTEGKSTSEIESLVPKIRGIYHQTISSEIDKGLMSSGKDLGEEYLRRIQSPEVIKRLTELNQSKGGAKGVFQSVQASQSRELGKDFTTQQMNAIYADPVLREEFWARRLGTKEVQEKLSLGEAMKNLFVSQPEKVASYFEMNPLTALQSRILNSAKAISSSTAIGDIAKNPILARLTKEAWNKDGITDIVNVAIPDVFQKAAGAKALWMERQTATEFGHLAEKISNPKFLNEMMRMFDTMQGVWKITTMFGGPHVYLPTAIRNVLGGHTLSWHTGAVTKEGYQTAVLGKMFSDKPGLLKAGKWESTRDTAGKMIGKFKSGESGEIVDVAADLKKLDDLHFLSSEGSTADFLSGQMDPLSKITRLSQKKLYGLGPGAGMYVNEIGDNANRLQHFFSRRRQGYTFDAALADTRKVQYDYLLGLTDFEKNVMRRAIPFYSWMRFNIPAMVQNVIKHPGQLAKLEAGLNDIEATFGKPEDGIAPSEDTLDAFLKNELHVRIGMGKDGKWRYFRLRQFLPIADLEAVASVGKFVETVVGSLSPGVKLPYEMWSGKSTFFKTPGGDYADIERFPGERTSLLGIPVRKTTASLITQAARSINMLDKLNPYGVFGKQGEPNVFGASRSSADLTTKEKFAYLFAVRSNLVDFNKSMSNAVYQYNNELSELKNAKNRALRLNRPQDTQVIDRLLENLQERSIP